MRDAVERGKAFQKGARRDVSPHRGSGTLVASDDGLANAGSDSVAPPGGRQDGGSPYGRWYARASLILLFLMKLRDPGMEGNLV